MVVGIETYSGGDDWALRGPADDACGFMDWLLANGVPASNLSAFVSSQTPNDLREWSMTAGVAVQAPTANGIYNEMVDEVARRDAEVFFLFWGGHGVTTPDGRFRLLTGDATETVLRNIDLDDLLFALRTSSFTHLPRQIVIVDACRRYVPARQLPNGMPSSTVPHGDLINCDQFVLLAAREGEVAKNLGAQRTGQFASVVLSELESEPGQWPPDMDLIAKRVKAEFESLRNAGASVQNPVFISQRGIDGSTLSGQLAPLEASRLNAPIDEPLYVRRLARRLEARLAGGVRLRSMGPSFDVLERSSIVTRAHVRDVAINAVHQYVEDVESYAKENASGRTMIVGPPGSGKSVLIDLMALHLCRKYDSDHALIPVLVTEHGEPVDDSLTVESLIRRRAAFLGAGSLGEILHACVFFFDAFDELPLTVQIATLDFIRKHHTMSAVLSYRSLDQVDWPGIPNCEIMTLLPIRPSEVLRYLECELGTAEADQVFGELAGSGFVGLRDAWLAAGGALDDLWELASPVPPELPREVLSRRLLMLREPPPALQLARTPYMLRAMTMIHRAGGGLDATQPEVLGQLIEVLWARSLSEEPLRDLTLDRVLPVIGELARQMTGNREMRLDKSSALQIIESAGDARADDVINGALIAGILETDGEFLVFSHRMLQDYCAAAALARAIPNGARAEDYVDPLSWWAETPWRAVLPYVPHFDVAIATLVAWIGHAQPELAALCLSENRGQTSEGETRAQLRQLIKQRLAPALAREPAELAALGRALSLVGDDRPGVGASLTVATRLPDIDWVYIPAQHLSLDGATFTDVPAFYISRYPVSNAQFELFLRAGGYQDDELWSANGRRQRDALQWCAPAQYGSPFDQPSYPVVGISYHEAAAFCTWLGKKLGDSVDLPSPTQWVAAARSAEGVNGYPWGEEFNLSQCNTRHSNLRTTTAVGVFASGASYYGLQDCGGNVWELCRPEKASPTRRLSRRWRNAPDEDFVCPIKGGSFAHYWCSVKTQVDVYAKGVDREWDVGFRPIKGIAP